MQPQVLLLATADELASNLVDLLGPAGYGVTVSRHSSNALIAIQRSLPDFLVVGEPIGAQGIQREHLELICRDAAQRRIPTLVLLPHPDMIREGPWLRSLRCTVLGRPYIDTVLLATVTMLLQPRYGGAQGVG